MHKLGKSRSLLARIRLVEALFACKKPLRFSTTPICFFCDTCWCPFYWRSSFPQETYLCCLDQNGDKESSPVSLLVFAERSEATCIFIYLYIYKHTPQCHFIENSYFIFHFLNIERSNAIVFLAGL